MLAEHFPSKWAARRCGCRRRRPLRRRSRAASAANRCASSCSSTARGPSCRTRTTARSPSSAAARACLRSGRGWRALRSNLPEATPHYTADASGGGYRALRPPEAAAADAAAGPPPLPELLLTIDMEGDWAKWVPDADADADELSKADALLKRYRDEEAALGASGAAEPSAEEAAAAWGDDDGDDGGGGDGGGGAAETLGFDAYFSRARARHDFGGGSRRAHRPRGRGRLGGGPHARARCGRRRRGGGATADAAEGDDDDCLRAFQRRVSAHPEQVVRYCHGPAASPLWLAARGRAPPAPPCARCGARGGSSFRSSRSSSARLSRRPAAAEAAAMARRRPQPLAPSAGSLDWGTCYTCSASCAAADGDEYAEEYVWHQAL